MALLRYATHGDVVKDPAIPVPDWTLNDRGRRQAVALAALPWTASVGRVIASAERKALEMAAVVAETHGLTVEQRPDTGETDRSATGYVPPERHEALADRFFAEPHESAEGWERAIDAQLRIVTALGDVLAGSDVDVLVVGHGAVGTLLWCHLTGEPIDRRHDQRGPGNVWAWDLDVRAPVHAWAPIEG